MNFNIIRELNQAKSYKTNIQINGFNRPDYVNRTYTEQAESGS